jgi:hypothetical protein
MTNIAIDGPDDDDIDAYGVDPVTRKEYRVRMAAPCLISAPIRPGKEVTICLASADAVAEVSPDQR